MTTLDQSIKRIFDVVVSAISLTALAPVILIAWVMARRDTGSSGMFRQERVGKDGKVFVVNKIRTMRANQGSTITARDDARITPLGAKLRRYKIDELPQLWNILKGEMSLVGPRPDVPGYMDKLTGEERKIIFNMRPGITGPATLKYRDEEALLAAANDPQTYNDTIIWPDKVRINCEYWNDYSFWRDLRYLFATVHLAEHNVT